MCKCVNLHIYTFTHFFAEKLFCNKIAGLYRDVTPIAL